MAADIPRWASTIRALREARGWSQAEAAERLRHQTDEMLPASEHLLRRWKAWEAGRNRPGDFYAPLVAAVLGTVTAALLPPESTSLGSPGTSGPQMGTLELIHRLRGSSVTQATVQALRITIDSLAASYAVRPAEELLVEARQWLRRLGFVLERPVGLRQHRELLELAGWLALLVGCLEYDLGRGREAEATRRGALDLGEETGNPALSGWAYEMRAWFALTSGDYQGVLAAAAAGRQVAGAEPVTVQLLAQEAKALARLGDRDSLARVLDEGRERLDSLPYPEDIDHHFVVDPAKYDFYAMDCYRHVGDVGRSRALAEGVLGASTDFDGSERSPMRIAEARITLGVAAARDGDLDEALSQGRRAIEGRRRSLPSLAMVARDLTTLLAERYGDHTEARDFAVAVRAVHA